MSRHILNVQCGGLPRSDQGTKNLAYLPISLASISMLACSRKIVGLTNRSFSSEDVIYGTLYLKYVHFLLYITPLISYPNVTALLSVEATHSTINKNIAPQIKPQNTAIPSPTAPPQARCSTHRASILRATAFHPSGVKSLALRGSPRATHRS